MNLVTKVTCKEQWSEAMKEIHKNHLEIQETKSFKSVSGNSREIVSRTRNPLAKMSFVVKKRLPAQCHDKKRWLTHKLQETQSFKWNPYESLW